MKRALRAAAAEGLRLSGWLKVGRLGWCPPGRWQFPWPLPLEDAYELQREWVRGRPKAAPVPEKKPRQLWT